ncbi:glycerol-3-phosphate acyltransferase [Hazenella sp. IB182353]|uniref:glycerol-3-phosphate acyltransferase n=1 Tax=Polycladospora coralii TaxID=2771432 RepID=UPI00174710C6|nr:glycerol-3-phosphate acyltransferase [Polycladospora coralii]MBS7529736.1 glycerol-3-phosphate acyltransferase [Polycladospora coralii]
MLNFFAIIIAYLIGAIPLHWWALSQHRNPFGVIQVESLHKEESFLLVLIDFVKGMVAALLGLLLGSWLTASLCAVGVVLGSMYPIFEQFRGRPGLPTAGGALFILSPILIGIGICIYMLSLFSTRYLFLSTLLTTISIIILGIGLATNLYVWFLIITISILVLYKERDQFSRWRRRWDMPIRFRNPFK